MTYRRCRAREEQEGPLIASDGGRRGRFSGSLSRERKIARDGKWVELLVIRKLQVILKCFFDCSIDNC